MSAAPNFFTTPRYGGAASITGSANTNKTIAGANSLATVIAGLASGSMIQRVVICQTQTGSASTVNNQCRFYLSTATENFLIHEFSMGPSVNPGPTVSGFRFVVPELAGFKLPSDAWALKVGFSAFANGDACVITAEVADA